MIYNGDCKEVLQTLLDNSVDSIVTKQCLNCGKEFEINSKRFKYGRGVYCSKECKYSHYSKIKHKEVTCPVCNKVFTVYNSSTKRFCSPECSYKARGLGFVNRVIEKPYNCKRKPTRECIVCGSEYHYKKITQKYCSTKCNDIHKKTKSLGSNNPAWTGGNSYNKRSYRGNEWEEIRKEVYERDNYTCQLCGVKCESKKSKNTDNIIQCHHIENYKISKNNNLSNLITLCLKCHLQQHK